MNERSLANLKPFTGKDDPRRGKGGRPKGVSLLTMLQKELDKPCVEGSKITKRQMFISRCVDLALAGRPDMIRLIWEYLEGKPDQTIKLDIYDEARRVAEARGLDPDNVVNILDGLRQRRTG